MKNLFNIIMTAVGAVAAVVGVISFFVGGESVSATVLFCGGGILIGAAFGLPALHTLRTADAREKSEGLNRQRIRYIKKTALRQFLFSLAVVAVFMTLMIVGLVKM